MSNPSLKLHVHRDRLAWFLDQLLDDREIFQLSAATGAVSDLDRLYALPKRGLLTQLADRMLGAPEEGTAEENASETPDEFVSDFLTKKAETAISRVGYMEPAEIQTFFKTSEPLVESGDFGEVVWALLIDARAEVVEHGYALLNTSYEATETRYTNGDEPAATGEEAEDNNAAEADTAAADRAAAAAAEAAAREIQSLERELAQAKATYTSLEKKHSGLDQKRALLLEENKRLTGEAAVHQDNEKRMKVLEQDNRNLRERIAQYVEETAGLQELANEREQLLAEREQMAEQMKECEQIKAVKETFTTDLQLVEEAVYKGHQGLEDFQMHLDNHLDNLVNCHQAARGALNQLRQTLGYLDTHQLATGKVPSNITTEQPRVGVFVDVQNMFYAAKDRFGGRVDYIKLLDLIVGPRYLTVAYAYVVQIPEINQSNFLSLLEHNGYTIKSKDLRLRGDGSAKGDWDVGIAVDVVSMLGSLDVVILASGDGDFCPLAELIKQQDKRVEVVAFEHNTSMDLQQIADQFFPIGDELLIYGEVYK